MDEVSRWHSDPKGSSAHQMRLGIWGRVMGVQVWGKYVGIVLNYCQYGSLYLGSHYNTGPYINFPHFGNSNLGKLPCDYWDLNPIGEGWV